MGNMGHSMSAQERDVFELMTKLLEKHGRLLSSHDLKVMLKWIAAKLPRVTPSMIFTKELLDEVGVK